MENLNQLGITSGSIVRIKDLKDLERIFKSNISEFPTHTSFCLIVNFKTKKFIRITIYPVFKSRILKLSFKGNSLNMREIEVFLNNIQKFEIIHTSGLLIKGSELFYECYLDQELESQKTEDLKLALNRFEKIFKSIRIEEIV